MKIIKEFFIVLIQLLHINGLYYDVTCMIRLIYSSLVTFIMEL
jgi:hypothetical protein